MSYKLIEVDNRKLDKEFILYPVKLYKNDPFYTRPIDSEISEKFDPAKNKLLKEGGDAIRWIVQDENGETVGRVAAFYKKGNIEERVGGCGFFDSIDNQEVANTLFDAAKEWLTERGFEEMEGPINFGGREYFWGCHLKSETPALFNCNYNHNYYNQLFENYGFKNYFTQITYTLAPERESLHPVVPRAAERVKSLDNFKIVTFDKSNPRFAEDFIAVYNAVWANFDGVLPMSLRESKKLIKEMGSIADPNLILFAYVDNKPVGFFITLPDIGQITRSFNGSFSLLKKIEFMFRLKTLKQVSTINGQIFGLIPEYQGSGMESALVMRYTEQVESMKTPYNLLELNWIGDFNPKMMKVCKLFGGKPTKQHVTYRYLFDRDREFTRCPVLK